jgi:hypothetical protein
VPESWRDPTKVPRIQISMSEAASQPSVGGVAFTQLKTRIEQTPFVRLVQLDGIYGSHNPKVGGSSPPRHRVRRRSGPLLSDRLEGGNDVSRLHALPPVSADRDLTQSALTSQR